MFVPVNDWGMFESVKVPSAAVMAIATGEPVTWVHPHDGPSEIESRLAPGIKTAAFGSGSAAPYCAGVPITTVPVRLVEHGVLVAVGVGVKVKVGEGVEVGVGVDVGVGVGVGLDLGTPIPFKVTTLGSPCLIIVSRPCRGPGLFGEKVTMNRHPRCPAAGMPQSLFSENSPLISADSNSVADS